MFTGIVERTLEVVAVADGNGTRAITLAHQWPDLRHGESIAVAGTCLTIAAFDEKTVRFDVIAETLDKTTLGKLEAKSVVNVERSLRLGDRVDGHFVQGHIDGVGEVVDQSEDAAGWRVTIEAPHAVAPYLVPKGSICVDGVSLTITEVKGNRFGVAIIPTTIQLTTIGRLHATALVNLEADMLAKTVVNFLRHMPMPTGQSQ